MDYLKDKKLNFLFVFFSIAFLALAAGIFIKVKLSTLETPFIWDEVDYTNAAKLGVAENALESRSMSFADFLMIGKKKIRNEEIDNSVQVSESEDSFYLRHFHPPLPVYYWSLFTSPDPYQEIVNLRVSNIVFMLLLILLFVFIVSKYSISQHSQFPVLSFAVGLPIFISCTLFYFTLDSINFHSFHLLSSLVFVYALLRFLENAHNLNAYFLGFSIALLFLTLETGVFILGGAVLAVIICGYLSKLNLRLVARIAASFFVSFLVLWPGILRTGSPLKSWLYYVYRIFVANNEEYKHISLWDGISQIIIENSWMSVLIMACIVAGFVLVARKQINKIVFVPLIIGLVYFISMIPFILNKTYVFPAIGILALFSFLVLSYIEKKFVSVGRPLAIAAGIIVLIYHYASQDFKSVEKEALTQKEYLISDLNYINGLLNSDKPIIADGGHILKYYLKDENKILNLELFNLQKPEFHERVNFAYHKIDDKVNNKEYNAIIVRSGRAIGDDILNSLKKVGYVRRDLKNYIVFLPEKSEQ